MSHSQPFSNHNYYHHEKADDSSTVFDADTVMPDEVPSLTPPMPTLTATATATDCLHSSPHHSSQKESPANTISELLRRIKSQHHPNVPSTITITTATATATRSEEISTNQSSSSSSKKRTIITNSSSHSSRKKIRQSSHLKRQQPQDQSCVNKSDSEVDDENGHEDFEPDEAVINQSSSSSSSQTSTTKLSKFELRWRSKYQKLCAYNRSNGNVNVPTSNKELGRWVNTQRTEYRKFIDNKHSLMTNERIEMLESIGFEWVNSNKGGVTKNESKWNKRFNELSEFKKVHGHTIVPTEWEDNKQLGNWVSTQRAAYKKFKKNGKGKITLERIQTLESIGFEWVAQNDESAWNKRFTELKAYKELHGHTNVSQHFKDNKQLGVWVKNQRTDYNKLKANKKSSMTSRRIEMLNSIGFQWESHPGRAPPSIQEESPANTISELLRRINSTRHHPAEASTTATGYDANTVIPYEEESPATATRSEEIEISTNQSSSSSSKKRTIITNSSSSSHHSSRKKTRRSSRLKRQPDQNCTDDKPDSEVEDENEPDEAVINQSSSSSSSQTSTTKLSKFELRWRSKFEELRAHKQLHGHTNVPQRNKQLGNWVMKQRTEYKKFKKNGKSQITPERMAMLESIGFDWVAPNKGQSAWNKRFNELKDYKDLHGHTDVPKRWEDNKQLGVWVSKQRKEYKLFKANKKSSMTDERIEMLNSIGFQWSCRPDCAPRS